MNRKQRRALLREQHKFVSKKPVKLALVPRDEWPAFRPEGLEAVYVSNKYCVQVCAEDDMHTGCKRLAICRVRKQKNGHFEDRLTWDELQAIKSELGYGDWYGFEVYPAERDVVNVANFRHLWLFPEPPVQIGWFKS